MTKRKDPYLLALIRMDQAIQKCESLRMEKANLEYLWDKYVIHGHKNFKPSKKQ